MFVGFLLNLMAEFLEILAEAFGCAATAESKQGENGGARDGEPD
jgi:hypothetical protein